MAKSEVYRSAKATISKLLERPVEAAAKSKEDGLRDKLGQTSGGQGVKYAQLPHRSSAPNQDPIKQSGRLQGMVDSEKVSETMWRVGMFPDSEDELKQARALEYGYSKNNLAERAYLQRHIDDVESNRVALEAAQKAR